MAAMIGENDGAGKMCPSSAISDSPAPMPSSAVSDRQAHGQERAERDQQHDRGGERRRCPRWARRTGVSARSTTSPPRLNVTPCPDAARASCISASASALLMLVDRDAELDGGERDVAVPRRSARAPGTGW